MNEIENTFGDILFVNRDKKIEDIEDNEYEYEHILNLNIDDLLHQSNEKNYVIFLPNHYRCGSHTLNKIATNVIE